MAAQVDFFTTVALTYEVQRYNTTTLNWDVVALTIPAASFPYTDSLGSTSIYYRVRDDTLGVGSESPWTPQFLGIAVTPEICTVSGYIYTQAGVAISGAYVEFKVLTDQTIGGIHYSILRPLTTTTDTDGLWEQDLVQTLVTFVKIPEHDIQETITIPALSTASINTLL